MAQPGQRERQLGPPPASPGLTASSTLNANFQWGRSVRRNPNGRRVERRGGAFGCPPSAPATRELASGQCAGDLGMETDRVSILRCLELPFRRAEPGRHYRSPSGTGQAPDRYTGTDAERLRIIAAYKTIQHLLPRCRCRARPRSIIPLLGWPRRP